MAAVDRLGLRHLVAEVLGSAPTTKVVRLRLVHWDAVTEAVAALRAHAITSRYADRELWGQRGRTMEEAARVGPVSRAIRHLKTLADDEHRHGRAIRWTVEGAYRPGEPIGMFVSYNEFETEATLLSKRQRHLDHRRRSFRNDGAVRLARRGRASALASLTLVTREPRPDPPARQAAAEAVFRPGTEARGGE